MLCWEERHAGAGGVQYLMQRYKLHKAASRPVLIRLQNTRRIQIHNLRLGSEETERAR